MDHNLQTPVLKMHRFSDLAYQLISTFSCSILGSSDLVMCRHFCQVKPSSLSSKAASVEKFGLTPGIRSREMKRAAAVATVSRNCYSASYILEVVRRSQNSLKTRRERFHHLSMSFRDDEIQSDDYG